MTDYDADTLPWDTDDAPLHDEQEVKGVSQPFVILSGVPLPEGAGRVRQSKYPWHDLEVSHSFFAPSAKLQTMQTSVSSMNKRLKAEGKRFTARAYTRNNVEGVMVWRVA